MSDSIESFSGEHRWLSNFWPAEVEYEGITFPSVENAYQAAKSEYGREEFINISAGQAKRLGRNSEVREDWEDIKVSVMRDLLSQKFRTGSDLADKLSLTGNVNIVEGNTWGDTFWGVCDGTGDNNLGNLIMDVRKEVQLEESPGDWEE